MNDASGIDRMLAGIIDVTVACICLIVPYMGPLLGFSYILFRDALPFLKGQSLGKQLIKLKVVRVNTGEGMLEAYGDSITRNISLFIPVFNILDAVLVFAKPSLRFGDKWAETKVIKLEA